MKEWMAVAVGGMAGSLARYALSRGFALVGTAWLPLATLLANLLGCFAIGWLAHWAFVHDRSSHWLVVGARIGVLGGLTTFSSFALDAYLIWHTGRPAISFGLGAAHVVGGLLAVAAGVVLAQAIHGAHPSIEH